MLVKLLCALIFAIQIQSQCTAGVNFCATCDTQNVNCLTCVSQSYITSGGSCICPVGTYQDGPYCTACATYCQACTSYYSCTLCDPPFVIENGFCICPNSTYLFGNICNNCSSNCQACSFNGSCITCNPTFVIENGFCICPNGTYSNGNACSNCSSSITNCQSCSTNSNCTICLSPFIVSNGTCVCPESFIIVTSTNSCICPPSTTTYYRLDQIISAAWTLIPQWGKAQFNPELQGEFPPDPMFTCWSTCVHNPYQTRRKRSGRVPIAFQFISSEHQQEYETLGGRSSMFINIGYFWELNHYIELINYHSAIHTHYLL